MTLEVKVEQDPVIFHVVIFENSIWRRVTNSVKKLKTLVWENKISCFKTTDSSSNIRRIIFGLTVGEDLNMEAIFVVMNNT